MENFYEIVWSNVKTFCNYVKEEVEFDESKKELFEKNCNKLISLVKQYMNETSAVLDRHKMAAIIIIAIIQTKPLTYKKESDDVVFVANYVVASEVGFSYMRESLNEVLEEMGEMLIDRYFFPESWTCENGYFRVFYRNLYFADNSIEWGLNPLDISEKLFLIEYITLMKKGINPEKLNYKILSKKKCF